MSELQCKKCSLDINRKTEVYTDCEWKCARSFHANCVNLSEDAAYTVQRKNIMWMCDECLIDFRRTREELSTDTGISSNSSKIDAEINSTKQEITDLKAKVAEIADTLASIAPRRTSPNTYDQLHSTPVSSLALLNGTKTQRYEDSLSDTTAGITANATRSTVADCQNTFALFLSNIDFHTSENDICVLVCRSLSIADPNRIRVRKLVSKWRTWDDADSISFKVVLDAAYKEEAMNPATWPCGVRYREFVQRINSWKPATL